MTLSNDNVIDRLKKNFVCSWKNIKGQTPYAGTSNTHMPENSAMEVTNCAGHHNVQMFFLTSDGRILHCLPGYWNPKHFVEELDVATELAKLYYAKDISVVERNSKFLDIHLRHAVEHSADMREASAHQGFDKMNLEKRESSDFHRKEGFVKGLKRPDQVIHERLAETAFAPFASVDVKKLIDMGQRQYSYDYGIPGKGPSYESKKPRDSAPKGGGGSPPKP